MRSNLRLIVALAIVALSLTPRAVITFAQDPGRSSRSEGESREERRERWRRQLGDRGSDRDRGDRDRSDRGRDGRSSRSRDDERRGDSRSNSSSSSSGASSSTNSSTSSSRSSTSPSTTSSNTSTSPSNSSPALSSPSMADYAKSLVKKYDKNGDGMLQADEQKDLHGPSAGADLNHDGVITVEELVTHLTSPSPSSAPSSSAGNFASTSSSSSGDGGHWGRHHRDSDSSSGDKSKSDADKAHEGRVFKGTAGGLASTTKEGDKRHSYRFTTPADRKPGLPPELKSRDANGDGQVSMSEFSHYWSSSVVADFRRWDLNNDGVITSKEAAQRK